MTSKQRAYLRGLANTLEPIVHAGKGGISDALLKQADDALTAREIAEEIAAAVNAQVVQVIGRTFVLFRQKEKDSQIKLPRK